MSIVSTLFYLTLSIFLNFVNSAGDYAHDMVFVSNKALRIFEEHFTMFLAIFCPGICLLTYGLSPKSTSYIKRI